MMGTVQRAASNTEKMGASGVEQKPGPSAALKDLRHRKMYLDLRIPRVREELQALVAQRRQAVEAAHKAPKTQDTEELMAEVTKRIYEQYESVRLKNELQSLDTERKTVNAQLKEARPLPG